MTFDAVAGKSHSAMNAAWPEPRPQHRQVSFSASRP
jgi:hypothetical protein